MRDYIGKNGFKGAVIGLSGGIDSALTLVVAAEALGADKVRAIMMPSPYTAQMSLDDSRQLVETLGVRYDEIAIAPAMGVYGEMLAQEFAGTAADTTEENLQARIRGNILMAISNKSGSLVLTTGNKSEMAVGYCTLYGDMAGGFAVIKDLAKTFVYRLCRWINREREIIPDNIIVPPPFRRAEAGPEGPGQPAALRGAGRHHGSLYGAGPVAPGDRRPGLRRGRRAAGGAPAQDQRIQAAPGSGGHPRHPAGLRQGLALSDHKPLC